MSNESGLPFEPFFRNHNAVMLLMDGKTGQLLDANDAALHFYGYTIHQLRSMNIKDINKLPPDELEAEKKRAVAEKRKYFVVPHLLSTGEIRTVEVHTTPVSRGNSTYLFSVIHDITGRKKAEEALQVSEKRFRLAYEASQEGLWEWNIQTNE